jgi:O-antigen ligase
MTSLKAMIVVLAIAIVIFRCAKPISTLFSSERDFLRRRNIWMALTAIYFISPSFWLFALLAVPLLIWGGRRDSNPVAFYLLLLQVIPEIPVNIPVVGINYLFTLDNYRLLSFCVLIPTAWRLRKSRDASRMRGLGVMDALLLATGVLQVALFAHPDLPGHVILPDSFTNVLRRAFIFLVDVYALYYAVSRSCWSRQLIMEAQAAFCLSCALMAAIAVFESVKHWALYVDIAVLWSGDPSLGFYLFRGSVLRSVASAGHPLALGYLLAIACGFWLYLKSYVSSPRPRILVLLVYWSGLFAAYSRGPWLGAVAIYFTSIALGRRAFTQIFKATCVALVIGAALLVSPLGQRIISVLPFMGGYVDSQDVRYRHQLTEKAWELIQQSPFFGDQFAISKMEALRQGQGIIDVVNTYVQVTLDTGLIGLSLFVGFMLVGIARVYRASVKARQTDSEFAGLGVCLISCVVGTLLMIENCSFVLGYQKMFYVLAGFAAAYVHLARTPKRT